MKINYLKLNNIGPYYGEHFFDLNTTSSKNIILIGGKNGAGKTTFLKSIKYGLFGCFSLGLKNETNTYFNEVKSFINNKAKNNYFIEIGFDFTENFETNKYILKRIWRNTNRGLEEKVSLILNNYLLDSENTKEVIDKLRAITSPNLINSFIFDGEKISGIIESGNIDVYLRETFNSIFNIDLIQQTQKDINSYLEKKSEENKSKSQIETLALLYKVNSLKSQLKNCESDLQASKSAKLNLLSLRKSNSDNFYLLGGLDKAQQQKMNLEMSKIIKEKEEMNKVLKNFIETDLPLFMNIPLLENAQLQLAIEKRSQYPAMLNDIENLLGEDLSNVKTALSKEIGDYTIIHQAGNDALEKVENRIEMLIYNTNECVTYIKKKNSNYDQYKAMKSKINNNDNIGALTDVLEEIKKIDISLVEIEKQLDELETQYLNIKNELDLSYNLYERMSDEIKKNSLIDSSFILGKESLDVCELYSKKLTEKKLKKVSKIALGIFNDTIRKNDFITGLEITNDFNLLLYNNESKRINPKILSAGEMQILVSSLIWSMFKVSGRREMFIFDTPLARLDKDNRLNFITKIISTISSQVVILSTDSEFIGDNLIAIEDCVLKKYLLNYDEKICTTMVTEEYFGRVSE